MVIRLNESELKALVGKVVESNKCNLIVESILINENILDKFKDSLRRGLITTAVLASLLSSNSISAQDKGEMRSIAQQNGIEATSTTSANIVTVNGFGKSQDVNVAKKMAISNAKYKAVKGDGSYTVTNFKIINEKVQQNEKGIYYYAVKCSMTIQKKVI